jgi:ABC-type polysaccharide/polyol phosphate transport system ATPase subunit
MTKQTPAPAIVVDGVSKTFRRPRERMHTLKERALHPLRPRLTDELHALRDVTFAVHRGEFLGVAGRNGSGKSTLLRTIAGIYATDAGSIHVDGRVSTFIELGVGFNLDLAARDNIVLNLTLLGLSPGEARRRVDAVVDFAELHDFVDLKLKNYSSGMMVRLGFSVMIHVDAEILLVDEILAVGDAAFQRKCEAEFGRMRARGATVVLVTHDMNALKRFCDRAVLLEQGAVVTVGDPAEVGKRYMQMNFSEEARAAAEAMIASAGHAMPQPFGSAPSDARVGAGGATITEAWFEDVEGAPVTMLPQGEECRFAMRVRFDSDADGARFSMSMVNDNREPLMTSSSQPADEADREFRAGEEAVFRVAFRNILGPGRYTIRTGVADAEGGWLDLREAMLSVMVTTTRPTGALVDVPHEVSVERPGAPSQSQ